MIVVEQRWCLICSQRPMTGSLVRVFIDDCTLATNPEQPQAEVCHDCAKQHQGSLAKPEGDRGTLWAFQPRPIFVMSMKRKP